MLAINVATASIVFPLLGLYRGVWCYASMEDLLNIANSATLVVLLSLPLMFLVNRLDESRARSPSSNGVC
jgi:FlaA1/EpsC-like NDP-sugar epimerase